MDQYVVLCYCDPDRPNDVAYINDDRAEGGRLKLEAWPPQATSTMVTPRRPGHRRAAQVLTCPRCPLKAPLSDTTAAEIVDLITRRAPDDGKSLREHWGRTVIPTEAYVDIQARSNEVFAEMQGDRDPAAPSDVSTEPRFAQVYVIPFKWLRHRVGERDKRRD